MKYRYCFLFLLYFTLASHVEILQARQIGSIEAPVSEIEASVTESDVKMKIHFLAADEFLGRDTGSPQLEIAARYIATWFMTNGVSPLPGLDGYFQPIPFLQADPPDDGKLVIADSSFTFPESFIPLNPVRGEFEGRLLLLDYGTPEELDETDPEGKIVVTRPGRPGMNHPQEWFAETEKKRREVAERGGVGLIELYDSPLLPWALVVQFLNQPWTEVDEEEGDIDPIPHLWLDATERPMADELREMDGEPVTLLLEGEPARRFHSSNVVGYIEGSDPELKNEYLLLGAHYDHIGVDPDPDAENRIYNGARDNAVGTAAILLAARWLAENPPKRSVIFAAWTAEEIGLLGSDYFAENSPLPLRQIVYNLNIDGAGYNDTTKVTVIGLERTEAEEDLRAAAAAFGLEAIPDPVPEQNLFDRSDNVSFARRGIPAPTYSLGITAFDEEIEKYYHTVKDDPDSIDFPYVTRYIRSFLLAARLIADAEKAPFWREGDFYEEAGLLLYEMEP